MTNDLVKSEQTSPAGQGAAGGESLPADLEGNADASSQTSTGRKAEIQKVMKTDIDRYYDEGLDKEYQEILEAEQFATNPDSVDPIQNLPADQSRMDMLQSPEGAELVGEWESLGGFKAHLANVQRDVSGFVSVLPDYRSQRAFMERFDRDLSEGARYALYREFSYPGFEYVEPADDNTVNNFESSEPGRELVGRWGSEAPTRIARIYKRADRLYSSMNDVEALEFSEWFDNAPELVIVKALDRLSQA